MIGQSGIQIELNSWVKYEIIGPVVQTLKDVMLVKYKWVLVQKRIAKHKLWGTKCDLWYNVSCRNLVLIMERYMLLKWMQLHSYLWLAW